MKTQDQKQRCDDCDVKLEFVAEFGAPGIGKEFKCPRCDRRYHNIGDTYIPMDEQDPDDLTLDPGDVI